MTELGTINILLPDHGPAADPAEANPALAAMFALMLAGQGAPPAQAAVPMPIDDTTVADTTVADDAPAGGDGRGDGDGADLPADAVLSLPIMGSPLLPAPPPSPDPKAAPPVFAAELNAKVWAPATMLPAASAPASGRETVVQEPPAAPTKAAPIVGTGDRRLTPDQSSDLPQPPLGTPGAPPRVKVELAPNVPESILMDADAGPVPPARDEAPGPVPAAPPPRETARPAPGIAAAVPMAQTFVPPTGPAPGAASADAAMPAGGNVAPSPASVARPAVGEAAARDPAPPQAILAATAEPATAPVRRVARRDGEVRVADIAASPFAPAAVAITAPDRPAAMTLPDRVAAHRLDMVAGDRWLDQLARDIARTVGSDGQLRFRLNPEHLGSLHVEVSHGPDGASVRLSADSEAARAILADARPRLIAEAQAQGVRIADAQVSGGGGQPPRQGDGGRPQQPFVQHDPAPGGPAKSRAPVTVDEPIGVISERYA